MELEFLLKESHLSKVIIKSFPFTKSYFSFIIIYSILYWMRLWLGWLWNDFEIVIVIVIGLTHSIKKMKVIKKKKKRRNMTTRKLPNVFNGNGSNPHTNNQIIMKKRMW